MLGVNEPTSYLGHSAKCTSVTLIDYAVSIQCICLGHNRLMKLMKLQEVDVSDMMDTDNGILAQNQSTHCRILKQTKRVLGHETSSSVEDIFTSNLYSWINSRR